MSKRLTKVIHLDLNIHTLLTHQQVSMSAIASLAIDAAHKNPENLVQALSLRLKRKNTSEVKRTSIGGAEALFTKAEELGAMTGLHSEQVLRLAIEAWLIHQGIINEYTGDFCPLEGQSNVPSTENYKGFLKMPQIRISLEGDINDTLDLLSKNSAFTKPYLVETAVAWWIKSGQAQVFLDAVESISQTPIFNTDTQPTTLIIDSSSSNKETHDAVQEEAPTDNKNESIPIYSAVNIEKESSKEVMPPIARQFPDKFIYSPHPPEAYYRASGADFLPHIMGDHDCLPLWNMLWLSLPSVDDRLRGKDVIMPPLFIPALFSDIGNDLTLCRKLTMHPLVFLEWFGLKDHKSWELYDASGGSRWVDTVTSRAKQAIDRLNKLQNDKVSNVVVISFPKGKQD